MVDSKIKERKPYGGCRYSRRKQGEYCWVKKNRGNECGISDPSNCSLYQRSRKRQKILFWSIFCLVVLGFMGNIMLTFLPFSF